MEKRFDEVIKGFGDWSKDFYEWQRCFLLSLTRSGIKEPFVLSRASPRMHVHLPRFGSNSKASTEEASSPVSGETVVLVEAGRVADRPTEDNT